jgi:hypothetical protein
MVNFLTKSIVSRPMEEQNTKWLCVTNESAAISRMSAAVEIYCLKCHESRCFACV